MLSLAIRLAKKGEARGVRLSEEAVVELKFWQAVLKTGRGDVRFERSMEIPARPKKSFFCDASGYGWGAMWPEYNMEGEETPGMFIAEQWSAGELETIGNLTRKSEEGERWRKSMVALETFGLVAAVEAFAEKMRGGSWRCWCDNAPTVAACGSMRAKRGDWTGRLLRRLWELKVEYCFELEVVWIGTKLNREADLCSRRGGVATMLAESQDAGFRVPRRVRVLDGVRSMFRQAQPWG